MTTKTREAYEHVFQFIDANLFKFQASTFHTDYEMGLRKALRNVFPTATLKGCWFHYCQAMRRKTQTIKGFGAIVRNSVECKEWYRKFLSLPLANAEQIEEMFLILKTELLEFPVKQRECLKVFAKYFEKQWMTRVSGIYLILNKKQRWYTTAGFFGKVGK